MRDLHDPETPTPTAADESGRSSQTFLVEVVARKGRERRRAFARGRDIYAITGPIVVEAVQRVVTAQATRTGVITAGKAFDARDFLESLSPGAFCGNSPTHHPSAIRHSCPGGRKRSVT
jgi:hypothetical protein